MDRKDHIILDMDAMQLQSQQQQQTLHEDYWTTVLGDFRRSVSNLVLFLLESIPMPWVFPQPPPPGPPPSQPFAATGLVEEPAKPTAPAPAPLPVTDAELEEWFMHPLPKRECLSEATPPPVKPKRAPRKKAAPPNPTPTTAAMMKMETYV